jgi:Zn-finger nucleic acid-binding protein
MKNNASYTCPECHSDLHQEKAHGSVVWVCQKGHGAALNFSLLRKHVPKELGTLIWKKANSTTASSPLSCAVCQKAMIDISDLEKSDSTKMAICKPCQFVWLDLAVFDKLKDELLPQKELLPDEIAQEVGEAYGEALKDMYEEEDALRRQMFTAPVTSSMPARFQIVFRFFQIILLCINGVIEWSVGIVSLLLPQRKRRD